MATTNIIKESITDIEVGNISYSRKGGHWVNQFGLPVSEKRLVSKIQNADPADVWWASEACQPVEGEFVLADVLV